MSKTVVLTGTGRDQVGIVAKLTGALFDQGCNLLDSSMTLLRGEFAIILMVQLAENQSLNSLAAKLKEFQQSMGLTIHLRELSAEELKSTEPAANPHIISVYGADKPGIVAGVTKVLADFKINISDVQTTSTKNENGDVFVMVLEVAVPENIVKTFPSELKDLEKRLGVDITVQPIDIMEL